MTVTSALGGLSFKFGAVSLSSVESGTGPYSYAVTLPAANALRVGNNSITACKSGYNNGSATAAYSGTAVTGKIQDAIDKATAGDTLLAGAKTYQENLTINKPLTLIGTDAASSILDGGGSGVVVTIAADNVALSGFTVRNSGTDAQRCAGVGIAGSTACVTGVTVSGCTITGNANGVALMGATGCTLENNTISDNSSYGIVLEVSPYKATLFSTLNTITGNTITGNDVDEIYAGQDCNTNTITNNTVSSADGAAEANGIYLWKSSGNTITGNTISNNKQYGIEMFGSSSNTITGNTVSGNEDGLHIRNIGPESGYSIQSNTISGNNLCGNTRVNLYCDANFTFVVEGNWWGSATEADIVSKLASWVRDGDTTVTPGTTLNIDYTPWAQTAFH